MAADLITIIDAAPAGAGRDWQAWLRAHWPSPAALPCPTVRVESDPAAALARPNELGQLVILPARMDKALAEIYKLVDALDQHTVGLLALVADAELAVQRLGAMSWARLDAPPGEIAARIESMLQRQRVIERLNREATLARRLQGGVTGEMNRMHEELELAATVQREFLPGDLPQVGGLEIAALFRPSSYVSGDIYHVQQLDETRLGFFIADATGHGVPAALMTVLISRSLSFHRRDGRGTLTPGEALARLNEDLTARDGGHRRFATAVCGIIDAETLCITLASAGHPQPLIVNDAGVREVETSGSLLGVFANEHYEDTTVRLKEGERLIAYTDGFELAFPAAGQDITQRRLPTRNYLHEFARLGHGSLQEAMQRLEERLDVQAGSLHQVDDLTILAFAPGSCVPVGETLSTQTSSAAEFE